ncbi:uncharacterized protein LOC132608277 [Lycium barbarum]|uniref:uncharacterized protein LOC132608277 n=1 Tax=Lycium barbarum TaxID=112863 RepID=UPI00293F478B|nr:uncharacterized protein LOC132608277 [Lycium barbarum]
MWMQLQNKLATTNRLTKLGMTVDKKCKLCKVDLENIDHFLCFVSSPKHKEDKDLLCSELVKQGPTVKVEQQHQLIQPVTAEEVKKAVWEIQRDKSPGPDGYGSQFYKDSLDTVGAYVTKAVQDFFRMKSVLPTIISANQSAFVEGRTIVQNILICQDPIDLKKAYDSVEWAFVKEMMEALDFPETFTGWVMQCVTTTQYKIALNGGVHGSIKGRR